MVVAMESRIPGVSNARIARSFEIEWFFETPITFNTIDQMGMIGINPNRTDGVEL